ncbi:MAG: hypothetical protein MUD08_01135, partial [Cytophagales bacterium]|nr:hypothetical protein [Cytophagales bacterium]
ILKGLSPEYDAEVLRVVGLMPKWTPGEWFDGRKITVRYALPVRFGIDEAVKEGFEADFKPF